MNIGKKVDNAVQNLKAVLLLGVMVNHAWAASQYIATSQYPPMVVWSYASNVLIISGLPVFFFLSGYFSHGGQWGFFSREYRTLLRKKFYGLLLPYLLWNGVFIVLFLAAATYFPRIAQRVESFKLSTIFGFLSSWLGIGRRPIDAPLWFIRDLLFFFLFMPIWNYLIEKWSCLTLVTLLGIGVLVPAVGEWYPNYYAICVFCLGVFARHKHINLHQFEQHAVAAVVLLLLLTLMQFLWPMAVGTRKASPQIMCVFSLLVIPCWLGLMRYCHLNEKNYFARLITPAAFFIYAAHFLVCSTLLHILAVYISSSPWQMAVLYGIFLFGGGSILLATFHLMKRFMPWGLRWFIGGRI